MVELKLKTARMLRFLQLTGEDGNLSLIDIAVIIVLIKLAMAPSASLPDLGTLVVALASKTIKEKFPQ